MKFYKKALGRLRMRYQFLLLISGLVSMIILLLALLLFGNNSLVADYFFQSSNQIYVDSILQTMKLNTINSKLQLERVISISENQLKAMTQLTVKAFKLINKMEPIVIYDEMTANFGGLIPIPNSILHHSLWGNQSRVTYGAFCHEKLPHQAALSARTQLTNVKIQEYYLQTGFIVYVGDVAQQGQIYQYFEDSSILGGYPCVELGASTLTYVAKQRSWYKRAIELYNKSSDKTEFQLGFTRPFLQVVTEQIGISLVSPLVDENLKFIGGWATGIVLQRVLELFKISNEMIETMMLTDEQGILLIHPFKVTVKQLPLFIFNETITGFNLTDWQQMLSKSPHSNCDGLLNFHNNLCRKNSKYKKDLLVVIKVIESYNLYLITVFDNKEYLQFYEDFDIKMKSRLHDVAIEICLILLGVLVLVCLAAVISAHYLFEPIEQIISSCRHTIYSSSFGEVQYQFNLFSKLHSLTGRVMSNQISKLYQSFISFNSQLSQLSFHKTTVCKFIEECQYPAKSESKVERKMLEKMRRFSQGLYSHSVPESDFRVEKCVKFALQQTQDQT